MAERGFGVGRGERGAIGETNRGAGRHTFASAPSGAAVGRPGAAASGGRGAGRHAASALPAPTVWQGELPAYLKPGAQVKHRTFGPGIVLSADAEAIRVSFAEGDKKLLTQVCLEMELLKPAKARVT